MSPQVFLLVLMCYSVVANYPVFDISTQMRSLLIPASVKLGTIIYRLRASDSDKDYPLTFDATDFGSYVVKIKSLPCSKNSSFCEANVYLDRVLVPGQVFQFRIIVKDTRGDTTTVPTSLTATDAVLNINAQFPHIPGVIVVPENAKVGTEVEYVVARRNLEARKLTELELWGSSAFEMRTKITTKESTTGIILLKEPLDFETRTLYKLDILATDILVEPGMDSRNIAGFEVVVVVDDVQDTPPIFINIQPVVQLAPNLTMNDVITKITAIDGDKGHPRTIKYGLVSEGHPMTVFFTINELTGEIRLSKPYRELHTVASGQPVILMVLAEEERKDLNEPSPQSSTATIALVFDQAINTPPYFDTVQYITHLDENSPQGTALIFAESFHTQVTDDNMGKNGIFSLTLENNNGTFEIWPSVVERKAQFTIRVRNNKNLDYERTRTLSFVIVAKEISSDSSSNLLSSQAPVLVYINDVNDNPPIFTATLYTAKIPENATAGEKVVQVKATDVDTNLGGEILYTAILGYKNSSLELDAHTGDITIANGQQFDREEASEYKFQVEARDMQGLGLRTVVPLQLTILDVNDNAPIFVQTPFEFVLASDSRNFSERTFIKATDQDAEAPNNIVRYEIISGNYDNKFSLHPETGELRVVATSRSKRQTEPNIVTSLTVRAYDMGVPHKWSTTQVRIYPPDSAVRNIKFLVPHSQAQLERKQLEDILSEMSGGRVSVVNTRPHYEDYDRTLVNTQVKYNSDTFVDVDKVKNRLTSEDGNSNVS
ncbi:hypothetical protein M8J77_004427 [Diaphorina citri]|nr:hypothetical protein M8J77_004427 [Diaphorina citri]